MNLMKNFRLLILISFICELFQLNLNAQIEPLNHPVKNKANFYSSDQPFASYWFPLEILNWSPSTDPDAPYNRSGVHVKK